MHQIELYPLAQQELSEAYQWYENRSQGLGKKFIQAVEKRLNEIANHPERYAKKKGNYRETIVEIFPYIIIYEVFKNAQTVLVLHVFHAKRNPSKKYRKG